MKIKTCPYKKGRGSNICTNKTQNIKHCIFLKNPSKCPIFRDLNQRVKSMEEIKKNDSERVYERFRTH